jgi:hypothetical protein
MIPQLFKDISWFLLEHGVKTICSVISSIWTINYLPPENDEILSISLSVLPVLSVIASTGLVSILFKKLNLIDSFFISVICFTTLLFIDNQWLIVLALLIVSLYFDSFKALKELAFSNQN